jgi:hypothetical protein
MGRIKKSKSIISNSSNYSNKSLLNRSINVTHSIIDTHSLNINNINNITNIKNIDKIFLDPIINQNIDHVPNSNTIIAILNESRKFDNTDGLITDFLIKVISIGDNNVRLLCNTEFAQKKVFHLEEKIKIKEEIINNLNNIIEKKNCTTGKYFAADINANAGKVEVIPFLSNLASTTGINGIIMCYYYLFYHGGYDINAIVNQNNLAKTAKLLESIGLTPDPCTGISPAFKALKELEQTLSNS